MSNLKTKSNSFIGGDVSLGITFWVFYFLIPILLLAPLVLIFMLESNILNIIYGVFFIAYFLVCSIAVWNSAEKYNGDKSLAALSKLIVIISLLSMAITYADSSFNDNYYSFSLTTKNYTCPSDIEIEWDECYGRFVNEEGDILTGYWILDDLYSGTLIDRESDHVSIYRNFTEI